MNHLYPDTVDFVVRQQPSDTYERGKVITVKQPYNIYNKIYDKNYNKTNENGQ